MRARLVLVAVIAAAASAAAQQGKWAAADDPTAKYIINKERQWAESACTHSSVAEFLAEDFQGTAPDVKRYDKAQALENDSSVSERDCRLDHAKVRVFGEIMVVNQERFGKRLQPFVSTDKLYGVSSGTGPRAAEQYEKFRVPRCLRLAQVAHRGH